MISLLLTGYVTSTPEPATNSKALSPTENVQVLILPTYHFANL